MSPQPERKVAVSDWHPRWRQIPKWTAVAAAFAVLCRLAASRVSSEKDHVRRASAAPSLVPLGSKGRSLDKLSKRYSGLNLLHKGGTLAVQKHKNSSLSAQPERIVAVSDWHAWRCHIPLGAWYLVLSVFLSMRLTLLIKKTIFTFHPEFRPRSK